MSLFLANIWGWIVANPLRFAIYVFAFLGVVFVISWFACGRGSKVKLNEKEQQEIAVAIEQKNDKALRDKLVEVEVKEAAIDANVANAQAATWAAQQNAREKYANMNTSELAAELEKRK